MIGHPGRPALGTPETFLAVTLLLSLGIGLLVAASARGVLPVPLPETVGALVLVTPTLVAIVLTAATEGTAGLRSLFAPLSTWRVPVRWYLAALFLPAALTLSSVGVHVLLGGAPPAIPGSLPDDLDPLVAGSVATTAASLAAYFALASLSEELGWRGYALPRLQSRYSALTSALAVGAVWALWHLPFVFLFGEAAMASIPFRWYVPSVLAISVLFTWVYNEARGSLLLAVALHASIQATNVLLPTLPAETGDARLYGISVGVTIVAAAIVVIVAGPRDLSRAGSRAVSRDSARALPRDGSGAGR